MLVNEFLNVSQAPWVWCKSVPGEENGAEVFVSRCMTASRSEIIAIWSFGLAFKFINATPSEADLLVNLLAYIDGKLDLLSIAQILNKDFFECVEVCEVLIKHKLIKNWKKLQLY